MVYKIVTGENSEILRKKAQDVKEVNSEIRNLIEEMRKIMKENDTRLNANKKIAEFKPQKLSREETT